MKTYIISPVKYEYNDEWFYEEGLEKPIKGFIDKTKAFDEVFKLNKKSISETRYECPENFLPVLEDYGIEEIDSSSFEKFTDEQWVSLIKELDFPYFRVYEVEIND